MKEPYEIHFHSKVHSKRRVKNNLPPYSLFPIAFANADQFILAEAKILHQYFSSYLFNLELYEIDAKKDFTAGFEIAKKQLFLFFMIEGNVSFSCENRKHIIDIKGDEFCASYKQKGNYHASFKAGMHRFLVITYRVKWLKWVIEDYPYLDELHQSFQEETEPYKIMPVCKINRPVSTLLQRLYSQSKTETIGELGSLIKAFVSKVLMRYNTMLEDEYSKVSYKAKNYIEENYQDSELNIDHLVDMLFTTEQTLSRNFVKDYGITPFEYLNHVRMQQGRQLLENTDYPLEVVAKLSGHDDTASFGKKIKKNFNRTATAIRREARKPKFWKFFA